MTSSELEDIMMCEGEALNILGDEEMRMDQEIPEEDEEARLLEEVKTNPSHFQIREYRNDIVIYGRDGKIGGKINLNYPTIFCDICKVLGHPRVRCAQGPKDRRPLKLEYKLVKVNPFHEKEFVRLANASRIMGKTVSLYRFGQLWLE